MSARAKRNAKPWKVLRLLPEGLLRYLFAAPSGRRVEFTIARSEVEPFEAWLADGLASAPPIELRAWPAMAYAWSVEALAVCHVHRSDLAQPMGASR